MRVSWSSMALQLVCFGVRSRKLSNVGQSLDGWSKIYYVELLRASEGALSRRSRLHLQSLAPTNPHWARVVGYGPFSLCVIYKEGLYSSSGDINRLMIYSASPSGIKRKRYLCINSNVIMVVIKRVFWTHLSQLAFLITINLHGS
jgi:hypothetical protein